MSKKPQSVAKIKSELKLDALAAHIREEHDLTISGVKQGMVHALRVGELLIEAKNLLEHGQWLPWLQKNCPNIEVRVAQLYMRVVKHRAEIEAALNAKDASHLTITSALRLLVSEEVREQPAKKLWLKTIPNIERPPSFTGLKDLRRIEPRYKTIEEAVAGVKELRRALVFPPVAHDETELTADAAIIKAETKATSIAPQHQEPVTHASATVQVDQEPEPQQPEEKEGTDTPQSLEER